MFDFWSVYSGERFRASWPSCYFYKNVVLYSNCVFSSPGRSPGSAIVLRPASALVLAAAAVSALAKSLTLKFFI